MAAIWWWVVFFLKMFNLLCSKDTGNNHWNVRNRRSMLELLMTSFISFAKPFVNFLFSPNTNARHPAYQLTNSLKYQNNIYIVFWEENHNRLILTYIWFVRRRKKNHFKILSFTSNAGVEQNILKSYFHECKEGVKILKEPSPTIKINSISNVQIIAVFVHYIFFWILESQFENNSMQKWNFIQWKKKTGWKHHK